LTATPVELSAIVALGSPKLFPQRGAPDGEYFTRKMSSLPLLVSVCDPKVIVFWKLPETITLPLPSIASPEGPSFPLPPSARAHKHVLPSGENFATKTSKMPAPPIDPQVPLKLGKPKFAVP